jgi:hypothetical protein
VSFCVFLILCRSVRCLFCAVLCIVCFVLFCVLLVLCCSIYCLFCVVPCIFVSFCILFILSCSCIVCFVLFCVLFVLCCYVYFLCRSFYCLCVNVYCTTATRWLPSCNKQIYHILNFFSAATCDYTEAGKRRINKNSKICRFISVIIFIYCILTNGRFLNTT